MATLSGILAWRIPWTESLAGYSPQGHKESDTTEATTHARVHTLLAIQLPTSLNRAQTFCWALYFWGCVGY